jgi:hypothetical protein
MLSVSGANLSQLTKTVEDRIGWQRIQTSGCLTEEVGVRVSRLKLK